ncbi:MAG TPA: flagellar biosynthesis protein FliQ [Clostridiales bacterium]|nr:flagellar biosynthesis protein FliQ [Clostridiales bacterium]
MNENIIVDIARQALYIVLKISTPVLLASLVVGLVISILQTITSIQEQTLTFVPKLIVVFLMLMLIGSWMLSIVRDFAVELITNFHYYVNIL